MERQPIAIVSRWRKQSASDTLPRCDTLAQKKILNNTYQPALHLVDTEHGQVYFLFGSSEEKLSH
ncbi:hypothetical protein EYF80_033708 [Liparis tanakae]|uniref:Uncharacterized protein n=1 Tax=Liparis tanakae TaxID=230148 RepID=A0A4Z2GR81_9TELE|nr:hypothetical protein EYF80_033708 [Liparis tanakae]